MFSKKRGSRNRLPKSTPETTHMATFEIVNV